MEEDRGITFENIDLSVLSSIAIARDEVKKTKVSKKKLILEIIKFLNEETLRLDKTRDLVSLNGLWKVIGLAFSLGHPIAVSILTGMAAVKTKDPDSELVTIWIPSLVLLSASYGEIKELRKSVMKLNDSYQEKIKRKYPNGELNFIKKHKYKAFYSEITLLVVIAAVLIPLTAKFIQDESNDVNIGAWTATDIFATMMLSKILMLINGFISKINKNKTDFMIYDELTIDKEKFLEEIEENYENQSKLENTSVNRAITLAILEKKQDLESQDSNEIIEDLNIQEGSSTNYRIG